MAAVDLVRRHLAVEEVDADALAVCTWVNGPQSAGAGPSMRSLKKAAVAFWSWQWTITWSSVFGTGASLTVNGPAVD